MLPSISHVKGICVTPHMRTHTQTGCMCFLGGERGPGKISSSNNAPALCLNQRRVKLEEPFEMKREKQAKKQELFFFFFPPLDAKSFAWVTCNTLTQKSS